MTEWNSHSSGCPNCIKIAMARDHALAKVAHLQSVIAEFKNTVHEDNWPKRAAAMYLAAAGAPGTQFKPVCDLCNNTGSYFDASHSANRSCPKCSEDRIDLLFPTGERKKP